MRKITAINMHATISPKNTIETTLGKVLSRALQQQKQPKKKTM